MNSDDDAMDLETAPVIDSAILQLSERDLLYELNLPEGLRNLRRGELQELLQFKRTHTEIQWEAELVQRQDAQSKALDFERLKKMKGEMEKKAPAGKKAKKGTIESDEDDDIFGDSDEEDMGALPEPKAAVLLDSDDDDSILFDSDDEREMSKKKPAKGKKATATKKPAEKKGTKKTKKRARDDDDDDDDDDYADDAQDDAASEGEEAEEEEKVMDVEEKKDESGPAELNDYLKIQTRRKFIETILSEPYFADALEGTFVRMVVGEMSGVPVYRMCEVVSVEEGPRKYQLPDSKQMTTLRMTVAIGPKTKSRVKFTDVSNRRITQEELASYLDALGETRTGEVLTKNMVLKRKARRDKTVAGHKYTKEEIDDMIAKKTGVSKVGQTTFDIALSNIDFEMERARETNDDAALERLGKEREKIADKKRYLEEQNAIASMRQVNINKKNWDSNYHKDMAAGKKTIREERLAAQTGGGKKADPFLRRPTRPENVWSTTAADETKSTSDDKAKESESQSSERSPKRKSRAQSGDYVHNKDMSLDAVRQRIKRRLGVDPLDAAERRVRDVYLETSCAGLPAVGSEAREELRDGMSLTQWFSKMQSA